MTFELFYAKNKNFRHIFLNQTIHLMLFITLEYIINACIEFSNRYEK